MTERAAGGSGRGIGHLFGVPGDFNLELLQQMEDIGSLRWMGTCSELNAAYAADGYARLNGMGALTVTNAVGALGAINGIAGSFAEHVPVILIAGSIPLRSTPIAPPQVRGPFPGQRERAFGVLRGSVRGKIASRGCASPVDA